MTDEQRNLEVIGQVVSCWNAGDPEGFLALYSDDIEMITDPEWPDSGVSGKAALARYADEWRSAWEAIKLRLEPLVAAGDKVAVSGAWDSRGASSGVAGELGFGIFFELRDGLIVRQQWFRDPEDARAAVVPDA